MTELSQNIGVPAFMLAFLASGVASFFVGGYLFYVLEYFPKGRPGKRDRLRLACSLLICCGLFVLSMVLITHTSPV